MNLQKFGKLMKHKYGSIGGELLNDLYAFYQDDQNAFEERLDVLEVIGSKGCFLYESEADKNLSFIVFGIKYVDKKLNTILIKGKIMARGKNCPYKVGDDFVPYSDYHPGDFPINICIMLDSAALISTISDLELITSEKNNEDAKEV